jgi:putative oxidoreductase
MGGFMRFIRGWGDVLGRFLLSLIFLSSALHSILHWHETESSLLNILSEWQSNVGMASDWQDIFAYAASYTPLLLVVATVFQFFGGLGVLLGMREKMAATLLILFLIPTTIIMHQFWFVEGAMREIQITNFLKNLAVLGGLFLLVLRDEPLSY